MKPPTEKDANNSILLTRETEDAEVNIFLVMIQKCITCLSQRFRHSKRQNDVDVVSNINE